MKNILIVSTQPQRFLDQVFLSRCLVNQTDKINVYFFISDNVYSFHKNLIDKFEFKIINKVKDKQVKTTVITKVINKLTPVQINKLIAFRTALNNTKFFGFKLKKQEDFIFNNFINKYNSLLLLVKEFNIDIFLIEGDRHLGFEPVFLKIAKNLKIPTIIPYMVYFAEEEGLIKTKNTVSAKCLFSSKYIKESEENFMHHRRINKYFYPHVISNALNRLGVLSQNPWFMGGGDSGILCLANEQLKNHYIKNGIDKKKIKIIGDISYDKLYKIFKNRDYIKNELEKKYYLDKDKNVIIALPQLGEHNILSWDRHWKEINFLMEKLDNLNQNILVSLHPKMDREKYQFLENKYNCRILDEKLMDVLPISDVFVATFSSTVIWSILCGIKTVVVDFYNLNYQMYDFLESIKKVDKKDNLKDVLKTIFNENIDFTKDWKSLSRDEVFDGKTIQRYINLINEVSK